MKRTGPPCSVCQHPKLEAIDADARPYPKVAKAFGIAPTTLQRHRIHRKAEASNAVEKQQAPSIPPPQNELEALEVARSRLLQAMAKVEVEALPGYVKSVENVQKRIETLKKEAELTEEEIVQSPAFRSLLDRFTEALRPYPDAARAMLAALEAA